MIITYLGRQFFKIKSGETVIAFNPYKLKQARFGANLVLSSINHPLFNNIETVAYGNITPFMISGPGEYEVRNILIKGIGNLVNFSSTTSKEYGKEGDYINTIYSLSLDNMKVSFLGVLSSSKISQEAREITESSDILFVPIIAGLFSVSETYALAVSLMPKIIIPMDYDGKTSGKQNVLKDFLKEGGEENKKPIDKLVLKKKDLEEKEGEIILLSATY